MPLSTKPRRLGVAALAGAVVLAVPAFATASDGDRTDAASAAIQGGHARNVILFIGDGMGDSEITIARNYVRGAAGRLAMDTLPLTGEYTTYSVQEDNPSLPDYVTDSAAAGTGWATGHKTSNGRISTSPSTDQDYRTILELAQQAGYGTGDVTTARLTDATPAVLAAHVTSRSCEGPLDMSTCPNDRKSNGGAGSIAEQEVQHRVDVLFGGGNDKFSQRIRSGPFTGRTVTQQAQALGYQVITDQAQFSTTQPGTKVLGLFGEGTLPTQWSGPEAFPYQPGSNSNNPAQCTIPNPDLPASQPSLARMTNQAVQLLDAQQAGQDKGFFLQVEGASIDKQDHAENPCAQIGETNDFDRSVAVGRAYAALHPGTLVVVTADHGHTSQITYTDQTDSSHSPGQFLTLTTHDGAPMTVNYGTNVFHQSQTHTGTQVRIAAEGPQAANVLGVIDQTDLFTIMARALAQP